MVFGRVVVDGVVDVVVCAAAPTWGALCEAELLQPPSRATQAITATRDPIDACPEVVVALFAPSRIGATPSMTRHRCGTQDGMAPGTTTGTSGPALLETRRQTTARTADLSFPDATVARSVELRVSSGRAAQIGELADSYTDQ